MVYRGVSYAGPSSRPQSTENTLFVPDVSSTKNLLTRNTDVATRTSVIVDRTMTEEEDEFSSVLDGLGPRFLEWWGTKILPVDADLLPQTVPGFKTPSNLRKLAKSLPCHFALGSSTSFDK